MEADYRVELDIFEGPLDLLLYLIKKEEIEIHAVSINQITHKYLRYLETFKSLNVEVASDFLLMAANLMLWKSKELLPKEEPEAESENAGEESAWDLIRQLVEYKKFKEAAAFLHEQEIQQELFFPVAAEIPVLPALRKPPVFPPGLPLSALRAAFEKVLLRHESALPQSRVLDDPFTVADKMTVILRLLPAAKRMEFDRLFAEDHSLPELIATFLAILELVKLNHLLVEQDELFGVITLLHRA